MPGMKKRPMKKGTKKTVKKKKMKKPTRRGYGY
jgi:hypothetical protein